MSGINSRINESFTFDSCFLNREIETRGGIKRRNCPLYLNGIYDAKGYFWPVKPPTSDDLDVIALTIAIRVSRFLEKAGYLARDEAPGTRSAK